jgi:hypothetical protein
MRTAWTREVGYRRGAEGRWVGRAAQGDGQAVQRHVITGEVVDAAGKKD